MSHFSKKSTPNKKNTKNNNKKKIVIFIDAGHGGVDPGAVSHTGFEEKKITIAISLKIKKLLENSKLFDVFLTRTDNRFISLNKRKKLFQNKHVDLLLSIHADSVKNKMASGASIWMISNNRMHREINSYLKNIDEKIFLPKYIKNIFQENKNDLYIKQTILDFQFNDLKQITHNIAHYLAQELKKITKLNKSTPNYASLGILSAINTPALLIETGFITNEQEEKKLKTEKFQYQIANSIFTGLKNYFFSKSL